MLVEEMSINVAFETLKILKGTFSCVKVKRGKKENPSGYGQR